VAKKYGQECRPSCRPGRQPSGTPFTTPARPAGRRGRARPASAHRGK
jgi:hypothetical protein